MHVDGVERTTASMIAVLEPDGTSVLHVCTGNPCEHPYTTFTFADAERLDLSTI
jgi:hypothetical protein